MPEILQGVQLKDLDATPKDLSVDGQCTGCGECCTNVMAMSDADISRIRAYIKHHGIKPISHFKAPFAGDFVDMCCPFLDDKKPAKKCTIYPVRPALCRYFMCRSISDPEYRDQMLRRMSRDKDMQEAAFAPKLNVRETFFPEEGAGCEY